MTALKPRLTALAILALLAGCESASPPTISVVGLWPEQPPLCYKPYNAWTGGGAYICAKVQSAQPILRWEAFPRPSDFGGTNGPRPNISAATYDLRIWLNRDDFPAELCYERNALTQNCHRVEQPLERRAQYFWSVRTRFRLDDQSRVTEWSRLAGPYPYSIVGGDALQYPDHRYYRFRTP